MGRKTERGGGIMTKWTQAVAAVLAGMSSAALQAQTPGAAAAAQNAAAVQTKASQAAMTPSKVLATLKEGNQRFAAGKRDPRDFTAQARATASGQYPFAAIVSCMDSRAPVEILFDQGIGDVFSLRNAGNVIDEDVLGSLEYAVKVVGVKLILVLGHSHCGAVKGAVDGVELGNLTQLLAKIKPAIEGPIPAGKSKDDAFVAKVAQRNVHQSMKEIRDRSQLIRAVLDSGGVGLAGGMYDIETGRVVFYAD
jgi:carbonic anhydrase